MNEKTLLINLNFDLSGEKQENFTMFRCKTVLVALEALLANISIFQHANIDSINLSFAFHSRLKMFFFRPRCEILAMKIL
jgi:hypothetical protein